MGSAAKPYTIDFEDRTAYLYALVKASYIDRDLALIYFREVADRLRAHPSRCLLLERHIPMMLPERDIFRTTNDFFAMIQGAKAAFVNPYITTEEAMSFTLTFGPNRGNYHTFNSTQPAETWLLSK